MREARLALKRHRIVEAGLDARLPEVFAECVALRGSDDEQMPDVIPVVKRGYLKRETGQSAPIALRKRATARCPGVKSHELVAQNGRLQSIHAIIEPDLSVNIALALAVVAQRP